MKFKIEDVIVDDYQTAFEIIKEKVRPTLRDINKQEMISIIKEYTFKNQFQLMELQLLLSLYKRII